MLVELSVMEQRYQAVLAVVQDGWKVTEVAARLGVSRQSVHAWIARYEAGGLAALADRSHRPTACPHQIDPETEAHICELRREHPGCGPRRIRHQLAKLGVAFVAVGAPTGCLRSPQVRVHRGARQGEARRLREARGEKNGSRCGRSACIRQRVRWRAGRPRRTVAERPPTAR